MLDDITVYDTLRKILEKQVMNARHGILAGLLALIAVSLGWFLVATAVRNSIMLYMLSFEFLALIFFSVSILSFFIGRLFLARRNIALLDRMVRVKNAGR